MGRPATGTVTPRSGFGGAELGGGVVEGGGGGGFAWGEEGDGLAVVAGLAGVGIEGDLGEEGDLEALGLAFAAVLAEKVVFGPVFAFEPGHVFDDAEDGDVDLGEHGDGFPGVDEGHFLGGGDDDGAVEGDGLHDGELDVAGAGGEVEDEDIEFAPGDLFEELLGVAVGEGAADDDGGAVAEEEAHGHEFDAVGLDGDDVVVLVCVRLFAGRAEEEGDRGAVEVAVTEADLEALLGKGDGEVGGDGGFADATLAGGHRDDFFDAGEGLFAGHAAGGGGGAGRILDVDVDLDLFGAAGEGVEDGVAVLEDLFGDLGVAGLEAEGDGEAVVVDGDGLDEAEGDDIAGEAGIFDSGEGGANGVFGHWGGGLSGRRGETRRQCSVFSVQNPDWGRRPLISLMALIYWGGRGKKAVCSIQNLEF